MKILLKVNNLVLKYTFLIILHCIYQAVLYEVLVPIIYCVEF